MALRRSLLVFAAALSSLGAWSSAAAGGTREPSYRTQNFLVEAPTAAIAQQIAQDAEYYRREKALQWLGVEMPPWSRPCPVHVTITMDGSGGATTFTYDNGQILNQDMQIQGTLERLRASVLPHEVTHTVFAYAFRCPVPRWADEGGSVLSEDDLERSRHDQYVRRVLNTPGRAIPLRRLFSMKEYPSDVMVLYAEGFSVSNFLVAQGEGLSSQRSGRQYFLSFVGTGLRSGWDEAVRSYYHYNSVEQLEEAWLKHLRDTKQGSPAQLASASPQNPSSSVANDPDSRVVVRTTAPPVQPLTDPVRAPVARGQMPDLDVPPMGRPAYLPEPTRALPPANAYTPPSTPQVRLGEPQFGQLPAADVPAYDPSAPPRVQLRPPQFASPVGYPQ
jgi:hypothetical protein